MDNGFSTIYVQKNGLFSSRKLIITLSLHENNITGSALLASRESGYTHHTVDFDYGSIINYGECDFEDGKALKIEAYVNILGAKYQDSFIFPLEPKYSISDVLKELKTNIDKYAETLSKIEEKNNERIRRQQEREEKYNAYLAELQNQFDSIYSFHIQESTPVYVFDKGERFCFVAFIGEDKSLNFLYIDARTKSEIHSVISYDEIHYYEKAGSIHYTTTVNADYSGGQFFGGSFVSGKFSIGTAVRGGLLFGPMGMAIGAMSSYTPAQYVPPTYSPPQLNISSETTKIDDRSIILNYYSQQHKQFVDVELPQEIFIYMIK